MTDMEIAMLKVLCEIDAELGLPDDGCNSPQRTLHAIGKLQKDAENLKDALVYSAFMQHETKQHMLPANISLINNDWVKVWLRDSVVDTGPRPNAFSKLAT